MNRILLSLATLHLAASYTGLIKIKLHFFHSKTNKNASRKLKPVQTFVTPKQNFAIQA